MPLYIKSVSYRTKNIFFFTTTPIVNGSVIGCLYYISSFLASVFLQCIVLITLMDSELICLHYRNNETNSENDMFLAIYLFIYFTIQQVTETIT